MSFDPTLDVEWKWNRQEVDWKIGARFSGQIDVGVDASLNFKGDIDEENGPTVLYKKVGTSLLNLYPITLAGNDTVIL